MAYNLGISLFGGLAPVLVTYLIKETANDFMPGYVVLVGAGITFFGLLGMRDADREAPGRRPVSLPASEN
jgi:hypothetical protein